MRKRQPTWSLSGALILVTLFASLIGPRLGLAEDSGNDTWTKRGPQHDVANGNAPMVIQIAIQPSNPSTVYAGTNQGVYRSTNGGESWQPRNGGLGGYGDLVVSGLVLHPSDAQTLIIGTWGYGLFKSADGGANWSRLTDPLATSRAEGDEPAPPAVLAGGYSYSYGQPQPSLDAPGKALPGRGIVPAHGSQAGLDPLGPESLPIDLSWTPVRRVAIHPTNGNEIYACIDAGHGLYRSTDGGTTWTWINLAAGQSARTYTFAPSNTQVRYASFGTWSTSGGLYRTTNGGGSWTQVGAGVINGTVTDVAIHPTNPNIVLAATAHDGLWRSTTGGNSWTQVGGSLADDTFYSVAFAPSNPNVAYAGGFVWIYRSSDGGASWANADPSFPTVYVEGLAIHPTQPDTALAGANYFPLGGVYKRTSNGAPFVLKGSGMTDTFVMDIEKDPNNANILYAATWGGGVFRSDNGGLSWQPKYAVPYIYAIEATTSGGSTVLYATTFYVDWGVLRSDDMGESWQEVSFGYSSDISFDLKSVNGGPNWLVAATYQGVEYSTNSGASWIDAGGLNAGVVLKLARSPANQNQWLAATYGGGIWRSSNAGQGWAESSSGLGSPYVYSLAYSPANASLVYAGSYGIYRSTNGGASWSSSGSIGTWVRAVDALGGAHPDAFAGTYNQGVYMAPDGGGFWLPINAGLGDLRIRSLKAVTSNRLFAGTNGSSAWDYTIITRPSPSTILLPTILRNFGQASLPAPTLYAISNPDLDGNYTVSWSNVGGATNYALQEATNPSFSGASTVYSGPATSHSVTGQPDGTYYYRVRASNASATSPWSDVRSVLVQTPGGWTTIISENFEGAFPGPWDVFDANGSSYGEYYWGRRACRPYAGSYSGWGVGAGASGASLGCGANYPNYAISWMVYGPFSLTDASAGDLTFKLWLDSEEGYDYVCRLASLDGNDYYGNCVTGDTQGWVNQTLDLTNVYQLGSLMGQPNVWIAMLFNSDGSITYPEGGYVDNVVLRKYVGLELPGGSDQPGSAPDTLHEEPAVWRLNR